MTERKKTNGPAALRKELVARGMSQGELERQLGYKKGTVTHWLTGKNRPDLHSALQLERLLGLSLSLWETEEELRKVEALPPSTGTEG